MSLWEKFQSRPVVYGGTSALAVLLVAGILIFAVLLGSRYSLRWDLTRRQSHSLSAVSRTLLNEVDKPLTATAFFPEGNPERQRAMEVLELYTRQNPQITVRFLDPEKDPVRADEAGYRRYGNVLLEFEGRKQLAETPTEDAISEALRKILQKQQKKIYFLTGHGERTGQRERRGYQAAQKALQNEGFELAELNLIKDGEVPKDAALVLIAAPQKDLLASEVDTLKKYVERGGRLFLLLAPFQDAGLKTLLADYGVNLNDGIIFEVNQLTQDRAILSPIITQYGPSRITQGFSSYTLFPFPRPLLLNEEVKTATLTPLAATSPSSWEKIGKDWQKDWQKDKKPLFDPKTDRKGPFTVAALVEVKIEKKPEAPEKKPEASEKKPAKPEQKGAAPEPPKDIPPAYMAVFGDADFAADEFFHQLGNADLFLNTVNFLASEEKQIIIRKTDQKTEPLSLPAWKIYLVFLISVILLPLIMLTAGLAVYLRRRALR
ncbi:MAG: Gldg family protein [Desulfobaccales bacterium]